VATLRLDQDTTRRRGSHGRILAAFAAGEAQILLGTQMVAKGHHFPAVDLVGVLAADDGLTLPDFRAGERAFQLLTQVAGRAGRTQPGRVVFQSYRPEDPIIQAAATHDYHAFAAQELSARRAFGYPPYRRLLRVGLSGRRQSATAEIAAALAATYRQGLTRADQEILGPAPAVFARLQDHFRFQLLIKGSLSTREKRWLAACACTAQEQERRLDIVLDIDPLGLY
jgi:primosomal protein N' (replication factor Y)